MPYESVLIGPLQTLTEDQVYALPARAVIVHSDLALEVANDTTFSTNGTITANTPTIVAGGFVRSTTNDATVHFKAY